MSKIELYQQTIELIARIPRTSIPDESIDQFIDTKFVDIPKEDKAFLAIIFYLRKEIDRQFDGKILKLIEEFEKAYFESTEELSEIEKYECRKVLIKAKYEEFELETDDICIQIGNLVISHIKKYAKKRNQKKMDFLSGINNDLMEIFELSPKNQNSFIRNKLQKKQEQISKELVQSQVANGKLVNALDELNKIADRKKDKDFSSQVISLKAQLQALKKDEIGGLKESKELTVQRNQLINSILNLNNF